MQTNYPSISFVISAILAVIAGEASAQSGGGFDLTWNTIDCGGAMSSTGGSYTLAGTIGQPDAGEMSGGTFSLTGGFWGVAAPSGTGVPAATLTAAVSRKPNPAAPGGVCDLAVTRITGAGAKSSEPHQGGITELRLTFDVPPGGPGVSPVSIEQATCAAPAYVPYSGASTTSATVAAYTLVLTFTPGLENARTYRVNVNSSVTSIAGQSVEVRGLIGDVNSDGQVNATDRSVVVGAWTGGGFTCPTDANSDAVTNATDRSVVVGAWTGGQNCAP